jgi:cation-transporting P-type ATPase 13A2
VLSECGLSSDQYGDKFDYFGANQTAIPEKSTLKILIDEILSPFYMFQVFSVTLWMLEPYYVYSGVIFFTSVISVVVTLQETKQNHARLRDMSTLRG